MEALSEYIRVALEGLTLKLDQFGLRLQALDKRITEMEEKIK